MLDVVQRYAPAVNQIKKNPPKDRRIVEVGGTGEGLGWYLPDYQIFDCDVEFVDNVLPDTKPIRVKNGKLPLPDNFADYVVSIDMLEHLPTNNKKAKMIEEMLRVARNQVILAVPTGKKSLEANKKFGKMFAKKYPQIKHQYLQEHLKFGHPEKREITKMIKKSGYKTKITIQKNTNARVWLVFQRVYLRFPKLYLIFRYRRFWYYVLRPIFPLLNFGQTLRTIFFVEAKKT